MRQLMEALAYLHDAKHVIHLDVKPENLLLEGDTLKLIDFGSAQTVSPASGGLHRSQHQQQNSASLEFSAPEVVSGGPVAAYTDMWSLGVIIYVCLR